MLSLGQILTFAIVHSVYSEKVFKSVPVTVKTYENDTVLLPCYIDEQETPLRVRWYKGPALLGDSADPNLLLPVRARMHRNYSLQVDALTATDTADYTCEVIRPEPWGPIRQTHSIEVQYSPTIRTIPEDGFVEVKKGEYVDIGCEVGGTPHPIVDWRKNGEPMALLEHRTRIKFKAEHRLLAGVYECIANNGVGDPVRGAIRVVILDAPVVTAERTFVHTAVGLRAALQARVQAAPPATPHWYKDQRPLQPSHDRIVMMVHDNLHQLIFRSVTLADFGNYTFRAENQLGMADVSFKLTGVPNAASFKVDSSLNKATSTSFTLVWEVDSYSTIIEYNLWLRPYYGRLGADDTTEPSANTWRKIVVPGDASDGPIHSAKYTVRGLTPSTVYEAIVTSRNRQRSGDNSTYRKPKKTKVFYLNISETRRCTAVWKASGRFGWSKQSAILHFATEPGTGRRPSTADYSDITPLLEEPEVEPEAHNITQAQVFGREEPSAAREPPSLSAILFFGTVASVMAGFC